MKDDFETIEKTKLIIGLSEIYGFHLSELSLPLFVESLASLSSSALKQIIAEGIPAWKFMPRPSEILGFVKLPEDKSMKLSAKDEFDSLLERVRRQGRKIRGKISKAAENALRQIGGIDRIADATDEEIVWIRKEFEQCFEFNFEKAAIEDRRTKLAISGKPTADTKGFTHHLADKLDMNKR